MIGIIQLILLSLLLASVGTIIVLVIRAMQRVEKENVPRGGVIERFVTSDVPEKLDAAMNNFLSKLLRRSRVVVLKIDNVINTRLSKIRTQQKEENGNGKAQDFKNILLEKNGNGADNKVERHTGTGGGVDNRNGL